MRGKGRRGSDISRALAVLAVTTPWSTVHAQDAAGVANEPFGPAEIIVTARKREESLRDVPISVSAIGGDSIGDRVIANIQDLTVSLPGVRLVKGSSADRQFIRGIGSGDNPGFEQSVGTFVDDIYHGRARTSSASLFDIERVEVLRGPQTTYFGNNAIAGALNVVTRDPGRDFAGNIRASYNPAFEMGTVEAAVDIPVSPDLSVRIAGMASRGNGWINDYGIDEMAPQNRDYGVRVTLLYEPTENFSARLKAQYLDQELKSGIGIVRGNCPPPPEFGAPAGFCALAIANGYAPYSSYMDRHSGTDQYSSLRARDYSLNLSYDLDAFNISATTGYSDFDFALIVDGDLTPQRLLGVAVPEAYRQISQEIRISSNEDGPLEYVAGAYYHHGRFDYRNLLTYAFLTPSISSNPAFAPLAPYLPFGVSTRFRTTENNWSAFGALTWKITPAFRIVGSARYSESAKRFNRVIHVGQSVETGELAVPFPANIAALGNAFAAGARLANVGATSLSRKDSQLSPSLTIQYDASPSTMLYGRYDRGFKAGGFNGIDLTSPAAALPFDPESVDAFEIGMKTRLFGDRVDLNLDIFRSRYSDLQLAGIVPSASGALVNRVQNAGSAITQGIEADIVYRLSRAVRTSLSATILDAHYSKYPNATATALQILNGISSQNLAGKPTNFAPDFSASWALNIAIPISDSLSLGFDNALYYSTGVYLNPNNDPNTFQSSWLREDLTISLNSTSGWQFAVIGKNLTNRTIKTYGAAAPTSLGTFVYMTEPPRNISIQFKYTF